MKEIVVEVKNLNEGLRSATEAIEQFATHFGEDAKKFNVDECFALLGNFFERVTVVAEVRSSRPDISVLRHRVTGRLNAFGGGCLLRVR